MSKVRQIRTCDPKEYDAKHRSEIRKAKQALALPVRKTKEEREAEDEFWAQIEG